MEINGTFLLLIVVGAVVGVVGNLERKPTRAQLNREANERLRKEVFELDY